MKTNLLYDATLTPNLELEFRLTDQWSLELGAGFNPFPLDDTKFPKWRHVSAWIAPRYWFCHVFNRGFVSFNATYAHYNVAGGTWPVGMLYKQLQDRRYQGDAAMMGVSGGWHFAISPHFSIELEAGVEMGYSWFDAFQCKHCGIQTASHDGHWFVLPKAGVNMAFPLGGDKASLARRCDCEKLEQAAPQQAPVVKSRESILRGVIEPIQVEPVVAFVPRFEPKADAMQRLRNRLLRSEDEYEPYDTSMALSADSRNVFLFFDVNVTKMDRSFLSNNMLMDSIMNIIGQAAADSTLRITHIRIVGFASFDGRQSTNERLAQGRAAGIKNYIQSEFALEDSVFAVCNGGESWAELAYHLQKVEFEGRDEVLQIIANEPDADAREAQIKKLHNGTTYRYMRDELKHILRNLGCITVFVSNRDDDIQSDELDETNVKQTTN